MTKQELEALGFRAYARVLGEARKVRNHYMRGEPKVCPDHLAGLITEYNKAEKILNLVTPEEAEEIESQNISEKGE